MAKVTFGTVVRHTDVGGGKQERGEANAPSGRFSSIHQLPRLMPKIEKSFLYLSAELQPTLFGARAQESF